MSPPERGRRGGMPPSRWARIEALFLKAIEAAPDERAGLLASECGDDRALRAEVEGLLDEVESEGGVLDRAPEWLAGLGPEAPEGDLDRIGPYRIVRTLGRGGMGSVYLAEREGPEFRQLVALKLMRRGLDTDDLVRRFRMERQILAQLEHPNIARLLDIGTTEQGLPYFVMEYVDGTPILEYCDRARLTVTERLRLFQTVCHAVQAAHRSLVVHRDLKPQNILVTADGVPKLLDFGIAKILATEHGETPHTRPELRLLTPEYSAPEQLTGGPITTACDVFALGILLYEMLAGRHPFRADGVEREGGRGRVPQVEPVPPAVALASAGTTAVEIARARGTDVVRLRRSLKGDLDRVVLKALREEPEERYASALSLSEDLERHLSGRPVQARPATVGYRVHKFVTRNRLAVAGTALLVVILSGSTAVTLQQSRRIQLESERVVRERDKALEVRSFLLEMFGSVGPGQATGDTLTAKQLLDRRAAMLAESATEDPEMRAEMLSVLAEGYERLGFFRLAEPLAREALDLRRALFGDVHPEVVQSLNVLGWVQRELGDLEAAEALIREAVESGRRAFPPEGDARLARALNDLGVVRDVRGAYDESAGLFREALDMRHRTLAEGDVGIAITMSNLAVALYRLGDLEGAVTTADSALRRFRRALGPDHQRTLTLQTNLAAILTVQGDLGAAAELHRDILERRARLFGPRHASVAVSQIMLSNVLEANGELAEAERLATEALDIQREATGVRRDDVAHTLRVLGSVKARAGRPAEALDDYRAALAILRETLGERHEEVGRTLALVGSAHAALGEPAESERAYRESIQVYGDALGPHHDRTLTIRLSLVRLLRTQGRQAEADEILHEVEAALDEAGAPEDHPLRERIGALAGGEAESG